MYCHRKLLLSTELFELHFLLPFRKNFTYPNEILVDDNLVNYDNAKRVISDLFDNVD